MNTETNQLTVGIVGAGRMGRGIARNLARRGHRVLAYDVSPAAVAALEEHGVEGVATLRDMLSKARFVITCLPDTESVAGTYRGTPGSPGLLALAASGTQFADATSSDPSLTRALEAEAAARGVGLVDAPLLRGVNDAWNGTVHVLLGGNTDLRKLWRPVLEAFSERVVDVGPIGSAHGLKALNNAISMSNAAIIGEVFHVAHRLGVASHVLLDVVRGGLADSAMLDLYGPRLLSGEHPRTGAIAFGEKDLGLVVEMAHATQAVTPVLSAAHALYRTMADSGAGSEAPSRLCDLLDELATRKPGQ